MIPPALMTYMDGLKNHDVAKVAEVVAEDLVFVSAGRRLNRAQFLEMLRALYRAFPDWRYEHTEPSQRGDEFVVRWRQGGTHLATWRMPGLPPLEATGRTVRIPAQDFFYTIQEDLLVKIRPDPIPGGAPLGILQQLGVDKPPL
jgi:predicted ester cyclase